MTALLLSLALAAADDELWVNAVKDNGRWYIMETGRPVVVLAFDGMEVGRTQFINFHQKRGEPPLDDFEKAWQARTPGIYRVRYHE